MLKRIRLIACLVLACSFVFATYVVGRWWLELSRLSSQSATATASPMPAVTPQPRAEPTAAPHTAQALAAAVVPARDSRELASRLRPSGGPIPAVVNPVPPHFSVGDQERFWISNSDVREVLAITATLRHVSRHVEMWVQDGVTVDQQALERAAQGFDERIYPSVHRYFGTEWIPGVDNNPRVVVLNARFTGAAAYYSSQDQFSRRINPYSNEREMFYMNVDAAAPGTERYAAILAHEFQHMVHWHQDADEDTWVNEGAAELAARLCGYGPSSAVRPFARKPDTQLNAWTLDPQEDTLPHYGAAYLWMEYFMQRMGTDALRALISTPENGVAGFEKVLRATPGGPSFDELFADWVAANLLDDLSVEQGRFWYREADDIQPMIEFTHRDLPTTESSTVSQYGTDYVVIVPRTSAIRIDFVGNVQVPVVPNQPYRGRYQWWSNRGDMSNTRLTRAFDLSGVQQATLRYALWYQLEDGWDYGYISVSTDDGATWTLLTTEHTTTYNPNGNAFGPGYTGFSGHTAGAKALLTSRWIHEQVDLTPYAGKRILVRFEMVTDDAVNLSGMGIDDISVPEIGFADDGESGAGGWHAEGFVRIANELPQRFLVQVITQGRVTQVHRLELDDKQRGSLTLSGFGGDLEQVVLAISGLTRHTTEPARYSYSIAPVGGP